MRKVIGVTINTPGTDMTTVEPTEPSEQTDPISEYFNQKFPDVKCSHDHFKGVTAIYFSKSNERIGRLRFSVKNNTTRYDYTNLVTGKLYFIHSYQECENHIFEGLEINLT